MYLSKYLKINISKKLQCFAALKNIIFILSSVGFENVVDASLQTFDTSNLPWYPCRSTVTRSEIAWYLLMEIIGIRIS